MRPSELFQRNCRIVQAVEGGLSVLADYQPARILGHRLSTDGFSSRRAEADRDTTRAVGGDEAPILAGRARVLRPE
jgi:hypothetical protein